MVVTDEYHDIEKVLIAFDGSAPAARSLKGFIHLLPYGKDVEIELVCVDELKKKEDNEEDRTSAILDQAESYLKQHNFSYIIKTRLEKGDPGDRILERQRLKNPDLVILGAHSVSAVRRAAFGSVTHQMITQSRGPLFLSP
jgi:nucleotide-binding universal stress UspA family protein